MADKKRGSRKQGSSEGSELKPNPLVEKLVPNPAEVPDLRVLIGLLGESSLEGYWRLYLTLDLDEYFEIPKAEIVHSEELHHTPIGNTILWVNQTAQLQYVRVEPKTGLDFLKGPITAAFLPRTDISGLFLGKSHRSMRPRSDDPCTAFFCPTTG